MAIENFDEVKKYLEENKDAEEVQGLFTGLIPKDQLDAFLEGEEGKKLLQPKLDKYHSKGLETWKANNLNKLVEAEVNKRNPAETPEAKQIRELQSQIAGIQAEKQKERLKNVAIKTLNEKGLPVSMADYFNADTDEGMNAIISAIEVDFKSMVERAVNEKIKGKTPPASDPNQKPTGMTKEKLLAMPMAERVKFFNEHKEEFNKLMGS